MNGDYPEALQNNLDGRRDTRREKCDRRYDQTHAHSQIKLRYLYHQRIYYINLSFEVYQPKNILIAQILVY